VRKKSRIEIGDKNGGQVAKRKSKLNVRPIESRADSKKIATSGDKGADDDVC